MFIYTTVTTLSYHIHNNKKQVLQYFPRSAIAQSFLSPPGKQIVGSSPLPLSKFLPTLVCTLRQFFEISKFIKRKRKEFIFSGLKYSSWIFAKKEEESGGGQNPPPSPPEMCRLMPTAGPFTILHALLALAFNYHWFGCDDKLTPFFFIALSMQ